MTDNPEVTLILPVYNEEKTIREIITKSEEVLGDIRAEIIVVDDGSIDSTAEEVRKTSAQLISHEKNRGKGVTLRTGFQAARGKIIVVMDADGQDDPREIPNFLKAQKDNDADFVNGSRFIGTLEKGAISKMNRLGTYFVDFFLNKILGVKITDSQAGFRCFKAEKIRELDLKSEWYDIETETVIKAHRHKFKVVEIPVVRDKREHGQSQHNQIKFAFRFFRLLFRIYLKKNS
jgi:glycosyltransferase involved in cell wall biosynthesis